MPQSVRELKAMIKAIQEKCKHDFVVPKKLVETKIKNVFSGFYLSSHHDSSNDCAIGTRIIEAVCRRCELEMSFSPTEKCPICFQERMEKKEKAELYHYFGGDDYNDYKCRCFGDKYTVLLYKCKNADCDCKVINLEYDSEKSDKSSKARSELRQCSLG